MKDMPQYELDQHIEYLLTGSRLAEFDRLLEFDVECEAGTWEAWNIIEATRKAGGWELCPYGLESNLFTVSGYFRRKRAR